MPPPRCNEPGVTWSKKSARVKTTFWQPAWPVQSKSLDAAA
jgi:hypothetical protein